mgnify:CR=1 FL=1
MHDVALLPIREIAEGGVLRKGDKVRPLQSERKAQGYSRERLPLLEPACPV